MSVVNFVMVEKVFMFDVFYRLEKNRLYRSSQLFKYEKSVVHFPSFHCKPVFDGKGNEMFM